MNKYLLNRLYPFRAFQYVVLPKMRCKLIAVANIMLESLTLEDITNFQKTENIRFAFIVEAADLEGAGRVIDTLFQEIDDLEIPW